MIIKGQDQIWLTMLGENLKKLRKDYSLEQRQLTEELEVDTAYNGKIEGNEKKVSWIPLKKRLALIGIADKKLLTHFLSHNNKEVGLKAIEIAKKRINNK